MKNPLNGNTKFVVTLIFAAGAIYGALKITMAEQREIKSVAIKNDSRLTTLEADIKYFNRTQDEMRTDIKTLLRRGQ